MEILNPIAELGNADSGRIVTPEEAIKLEGEKFFCPDHDCKDPERRLLIVNARKKQPHFRHWPSFQHEIMPETMLHKLAVRWFVQRDSFEIPAHRGKNLHLKQQAVRLDITQTRCEYRKLERHVPDVRLLSIAGFEFAIEIVVTSDIDHQKAKAIGEFGLPTLRIDLSQFYIMHNEKCRTDYQFIMDNLDSLLSAMENKHWYIPPTHDQLQDKLEFEEVKVAPTPQKVPSNDAGCLIVLLTLGLILLFKWENP